MTVDADLADRCQLLPPNAWEVATARAVMATGFPVVGTTSGGDAATRQSQPGPASPEGAQP